MYMPLEGNIVIFEDSMIQKNIDEMELAQDIDNAIRNREFEVYYEGEYLGNEKTSSKVEASYKYTAKFKKPNLNEFTSVN